MPLSHLSSRRFIPLKIVLVGPPACGKSDYIKELSLRYEGAQKRTYRVGDTQACRLDFIDPRPIADGKHMSVSVHSLVGEVQYEALYEALLSNADAVMIILDMTPARMPEGLEAMIKAADCLSRSGLDVKTISLVYQYHRVERATEEDLAKWDDILARRQTGVPCFRSRSDFSGEPFEGFELLLNAAYQRLSQESTE